MASDHAISDPLLPAAAPEDTATRSRLRFAGAVLFGAGAATLAGVLVSPDPDSSDHVPFAACGIAFALVALILLAWRRPPALMLHAICPLGSVATAAVTAYAEPIGLTPVFFVWPLLIAAYFFSRRALVLNFGFAIALCAFVLAVAVEPVLRTAMFLGVVGLAGSVTVIVATLRAGVRGGAGAGGARGARSADAGAQPRRVRGPAGVRDRALRARRRRLRADRARRRSLQAHQRLARPRRRRRGAAPAGGLRRRVKRRSDVFARIGGEEFAVILPDTDAAGATMFAEHLRRRIATIDPARPMTVSVGVTDRDISGDSLRAMLADADEAMYAAKRTGRDRVMAVPRLLVAS